MPRNNRIAVYLEADDLATVDRIRAEFGGLSRSAVAGALIRQTIAAIERGGFLIEGLRLGNAAADPGQTYAAQQDAIAAGAFDPTTDPADGGHTADAYAGPEFGYIPPPNLLNGPVFRTEAQATMGELLECVNATCPHFPHYYRKGWHEE